MRRARRLSNTIRASACAALMLACACAAAAGAPAAAVATAHPLATKAGLEILEAGGNAFDAAIAVTAALAVVEPYGSGLGGGGFWLLHRAADGYQVMIDGRERAPLAAHRDMYLDPQGRPIPGASVDGALAAAIPGTPAAIAHIAEHYGRLPLARCLDPAVRLARTGFPVDERFRLLAGFRREALLRSPAAAAVYLDGGVPAEPGAVIRQPELAATLETIGRQGASGFYAGAVAHDMVQAVREAGGIWSEADLSSYRVVERDPIRANIADLHIVSAAPPSSGGIALVTMLNILSGYPLHQLAPVTRDHLTIEAMRRAYRDRAQYLGDPDFITIPTDILLHPYYAAGLRNTIRSDRATPSDLLPGIGESSLGDNTTHFSILDRDGNRVAATMSINYPFGSGFMPPGTGVILNDEMDDFSMKPGVANVYGLVGDTANAIAPGKRPLSSMSPTFLESERGIAILGTPGGSRIISMVLLAALDFAAGGDPTDWVTRRRFHHQYLPDEVQYEEGAFDDEERRALAAQGHVLKQRSRPYGNMQAIVWDYKTGRVQAASDPRGIGNAAVH